MPASAELAPVVDAGGKLRLLPSLLGSQVFCKPVFLLQDEGEASHRREGDKEIEEYEEYEEYMDT